MGAQRAEKFTDYYLVLGIEPKANAEAISQAYQKLARKFHPDNPATGDRGQFALINESYEVLSDPGSRTAFDSLRSANTVDSTAPAFSGGEFFDSLAVQRARRTALLCVLYDRRRLKPSSPGLSIRQIEGLVAIQSGDLSFSIWYLKQRGLIVSDDKSSLQISVEGMDFLEANLPSLADVAPYLRSNPGVTVPVEIRPENLTEMSARIRARTRQGA